MPQIGLHVPDGPEMNWEQAMPEKFMPEASDELLPCPLCGADVNVPSDYCLAVDSTFPAHIRELMGRALAQPTEEAS